MPDMIAGKWKCNQCGAVLDGPLTYEHLKGQVAHRHPTGFDCRGTSFARIFGVEARADKEPNGVKITGDDLDFTTPSSG